MKAFSYSRIINRSQLYKVVAKTSLLLFAGCASILLAQGQDQKYLVLGDQYFAAGEYLTAAGLYNQYLHPVVKEIPPSGFPLNSKKGSSGNTAHYSNKLDVLFKQAESYRLANYWKEAASLYQQCYEKDSIKYATALYWYAVSQRSLGHYVRAEESIQHFLLLTSDALWKSVAEKEKSVLQFIKRQLVRPDTVLFQVLKIETATETGKALFAPVATSEHNFVFTSIQKDSLSIPGVNPNHNRLFYSILQDGRLQNIEPLLIEGLDASLNQGAASISADGQYLYFTQWKKEKEQSFSSIYYAVKKRSGWSQPVLLPAINQIGYNSKQPFCSPDGKFLFFASDRVGGKGNFDIWYAPLQADGTTGEPVNAGPMINTADNELAPFYHTSTETLVFASDRAMGMGGFDLFTAMGKDASWEQPQNMGYPVNSSRDDIYFYAAENVDLLHYALVSTDRGGDCCLSLFSITKAEKNKRLSGIVRDCETNKLVTAAEVQMKDGTGKTVTTRTNSEGQYVFELNGTPDQYQLVANREAYLQKEGNIIVESINKKGWLIDTVYNTAICLDKKLVIKVENIVTVYFDFDQSKLKERSQTQMDSIYSVLVENPTATIQISGYTDGRGSAEYNKKLSDKRAKSCADYLIEKGIEASRISFESFGSCCPVEMELINGRDNPDGRSSNRRALINIKRD